MIKASLTAAFVLVLSFCFGQYRHVLLKDTSELKNFEYVIIKTDDLTSHPTRNYVIDYGCMASNKKDTNYQYSRHITDSIRIIKLKSGIKLLSLRELLEKSHIQKKYYDLPVFIDSIIVYDRNTSYFQRSAITSVKVKKEKKTDYKYISVFTIHHTNNPIADIYIRGAVLKRREN